MGKRVHIYTADGFNESAVKRDEGGKFSAQQHTAAAEHHNAQAAKHPDKTVAKAHAEAAQAHTLAAQHIAAQTGWQEHNAQKAHNATANAQRAEQNATGAANADQLKAVAADPKQPLSARAEAVKQLEGMQKQADLVAGSSLAVPEPAAHVTSHINGANISPEMKARFAKLAPAIKVQRGAPSPAPKPPRKVLTQADFQAFAAKKGYTPEQMHSIFSENLASAQRMFPKKTAELHGDVAARMSKLDLGAYGAPKRLTISPEMKAKFQGLK